MSYDLTPSPSTMDVFDEATDTRDGAVGRMTYRPDDCWECCVPPTLETRILQLPQTCERPPCDFSIPAMPCPTQCKPYAEKCNSLCFDWRVHAPGPNDSYGLNGLNPHDWKMEDKFVEDIPSQLKRTSTEHPAFSKMPTDPNDPVKGLVCELPMECYSREPGYRPCNLCPFAQDVNYFRDWRCCESKKSEPWRPPYKQWATGRAA